MHQQHDTTITITQNANTQIYTKTIKINPTLATFDDFKILCNIHNIKNVQMVVGDVIYSTMTGVDINMLNKFDNNPSNLSYKLFLPKLNSQFITYQNVSIKIKFKCPKHKIGIIPRYEVYHKLPKCISNIVNEYENLYDIPSLRYTKDVINTTSNFSIIDQSVIQYKSHNNVIQHSDIKYKINDIQIGRATDFYYTFHKNGDAVSIQHKLDIKSDIKHSEINSIHKISFTHQGQSDINIFLDKPLPDDVTLSVTKGISNILRYENR